MSSTVNFKGKTINFESRGQGRVVVLLHGFLGALQIWNHFSEELAKNYQVVAVDLPGHGQSEVLEEVHSMDLMAESVKAVLDELRITECVIVGHSMGGYVALAFADIFPEMVRGIGLFHSQATADTEEVKENRRRTVNIVKMNRGGFISQFIPDLFAEASVSLFQEEVEALKNMALKTPAEGIIAAIEGMKQRTGKLDLLMKSKIPFLFIAGKKDPRIPVQNIMAQAMLPDHSEVLILANVGHMGFVEAKAQTLNMIKGFLVQVYA
jgi:pimeloyl-ACP methyl ester carboxylesterase